MPSQVASELKTLDRIARALAETTDLKEVKTIRDKAEAVRTYAQSAALGRKIQNYAAELKLRAERRAGELLVQLIVRGGDQKSNARGKRLKLADLGIDHNQSSRWRQEAAVPEQAFDQYVIAANKRGEDITTKGLLRLARSLAARREDTETRNSRSAETHGSHVASSGRTSTAKSDSPRRNGRNTEPAQDVREASERSAAELLEELSNHRRLLAQILEPICEGRNGTLELAQRRMVARLLADIEQSVIALSSLHAR